MNIEQLLHESQLQDETKVDLKAPASHLWFNEFAQIEQYHHIRRDEQVSGPYMLTDWAHRQLFQKLGPTVFKGQKGKSLPGDYLMALDPSYRAYLLNKHMESFKGRDWFVRTNGEHCRAILSEGYADISNTSLLDLLAKVTEAEGIDHNLHASSVTPDGLNVKIIWRNIEVPGLDPSSGNGNWGVGVYIGNGEIGNKKLRMLPYIQRHSCSNSLMVDNDKGGLEFSHVGSPHTKMTLIKAKMIEVLPIAAQLIETMIQADAEKLPSFHDVLNGISLQYNWNDDFKLRVGTGTEGRETRAGIVNGITFAAQSIADPDARADTEIMAGRILLAPDSVFHKAAQLSQIERDRE